jgi:hypothetical protein
LAAAAAAAAMKEWSSASTKLLLVLIPGTIFIVTIANSTDTTKGQPSWRGWGG